MTWDLALGCLAAGLVIAALTTPVGVSGAVFLLPVQVSLLGVPSPAVTPTNLLFKDQRPAPLPEGLRFCDLRHTCASLLIAQGASITLDTYGHLFPSEMEAPSDRLELVRDAALAKRPRTQRGPTANSVSKRAGR